MAPHRWTDRAGTWCATIPDAVFPDTVAWPTRAPASNPESSPWPAPATIGILTGGGDVPGLNSVIKSVTYRATELGYEVLGIRRGWEGLTHHRPGPTPRPATSCRSTA